MYRIFSLFFVFLLFSSSYAIDDPTLSIPGLEDLDSDNFDKVITGTRHALVEFYAPWCGHCKRAVPELQKLANLIKSDPAISNQVIVAKVNADKDRKIGDRFGIKGFPTFKFFPRGQKNSPLDYQEGRTAESFLQYIKQKIQEDKIGRVDSLDTLVQNFGLAENKEQVLEQVKAAADKLSGDSLEYSKLYINYIQKSLDKGYDYLSKESKRLSKILEGTNVAPYKVQELFKKVNVLQALTEVSEEEE